MKIVIEINSKKDLEIFFKIARNIVALDMDSLEKEESKEDKEEKVIELS